MAAYRLYLITAFTLSILRQIHGQDLDEALQRLLQKAGKRPLTLTWRNQSSLSFEESEEARKKFESQLEGATGGAVEATATLSENPRGYLIVLQLPEGRVYTESWPRPAIRAPKSPFRLTRVSLAESDRPILDAAVSPDGKTTVYLEPFRVASIDGRSAGLPLPRPLPRDARGRIQLSDDGEIRVLLPGLRCTGNLKKMQCAPSDEAWIVPGRNYFKGARGPYYSMIELPGGAAVQSEVDGQTRLYLNQTEPTRVLENWGSELATVEGGCGSGGSRTQIIASLETDQVQAFEFADGRLRPTTDPIPANGPVVALWPASDRKDQVTMVVRQRSKGAYEASRLAIGCAE